VSSGFRRNRGGAVAVVSARHVAADPVGFWLSRLRPYTASVMRGDLDRFMRWVHQKPEWRGVEARELITRHLEADDPYEILNLIQEYIRGCHYCKSTNKRNYSAIRSFFLHNRAPLPPDLGFRVPGYKPPNIGRLSVGHVTKIALAAKPRDRSIILTKWQGLLDTEGVMWVGTHLAGEIVTEIRVHHCPIRLDLPGRKHAENEQPFFCYIGRDAIDALTAYFQHERGWPRKGEPLWLNKYGRPMTARTWAMIWLQLVRRAGLIPQEHAKETGTRYGYNTHEMRDVARSLLHTHGKADGLDQDCVELWLGHEIDPLHYNKFYLDREYVEQQYRLAEKFLNIISNPQQTQEEFKKRDEELQQLRQDMADMKAYLKRLAHGDDVLTTEKS